MSAKSTALAELVGWIQSDAGAMVVAGALGGLVRWVTLREHWREGLGSLVVGSICALYLGPLVEPVLGPVVGAVSPADPAGFSAFVVGLGGIAFAGFVIDILRRFRAGKAGDHETR